ncbi:hypothetical protein EYR41_009792 [Orbilia oligospora]|uniref:Uncharacterized protein n=1 Tax=Orbilia oligospora TaxID=2813651 RepID=A0A7C8P178_ORBOL|nr:hypothetical protein TWF751_002204 [Orbilia oligospora]TGJ65849.1 hypothetical protein EYR41_009792 [Orbilia oligospora]
MNFKIIQGICLRYRTSTDVTFIVCDKTITSDVDKLEYPINSSLTKMRHSYQRDKVVATRFYSTSSRRLAEVDRAVYKILT